MKTIIQNVFGKDKKKPHVVLPFVETPEMKQSQLDSDLKDYEGTHADQLAQTKAEMEGNGTYADTREGNSTLNAVAGARERGAKDLTLAHINALRSSLGLPVGQKA